MTQKKVDDLDAEFFNLIVSNSVISFKDTILYHSGDTGTDFFDIDQVSSNLSSQRKLLHIVEEYVNNIAEQGLNFDKIALIHKDMGPIGLVAYASSLSRIFDKNMVIVKRWQDLRNDNLRIKGAKMDEEDEVLLLDDVVSTGETQKSAIRAIQSTGANVSGLLTLYTRKWNTLSDISATKNIDYIEAMVSHEELEYMGLSLPENSEEYFNKDFIERYGYMMDRKDEDLKQIDEKIEEDIDKLSQKYELSFDNDFKKALKNLYFNRVLFENRTQIYTDREMSEGESSVK